MAVNARAEKKGRRRGTKRGSTTAEAVYVTVAFSCPVYIFMAAMGVQAHQQYVEARDYMLQELP